MNPDSSDVDRPPLFSSDRERRLWRWTIAVVVAIYSTLGLASTLVGILVERGVFQNAFVTAFLMMVVAVMTQGLKVRPRGVELGVGIGVAAVYLMIFARLGIPERTHLFEYGVVGVLVYEALAERAQQGRRVPLVPLLAVVATSLIGTVDECIQGLLPSRVFDLRDILFNCLAAAASTVACMTLHAARRIGDNILRRRSN